jgi:DNA primase
VGIPGGVATCGAIISSEQIEIMRRAEVLIIAMDNDEAGKKASNFLLDSFRKLGLECWFFNYGDSDKKDIGDLTPDQIDWGLENARHCVLGRSAIQ